VKIAVPVARFVSPGASTETLRSARSPSSCCLIFSRNHHRSTSTSTIFLRRWEDSRHCWQSPTSTSQELSHNLERNAIPGWGQQHGTVVAARFSPVIWIKIAFQRCQAVKRRTKQECIFRLETAVLLWG